MKLIILFFLFFNLASSSDVFEKSYAIVTNIKTNLIWQDNIEVTQYTEDFTMANVFCENLILNNYTHWELPTIKELHSIIDIDNKNKTINKKFKYVKPVIYWSKTQDVKDTNILWLVDFKTAKTLKSKTDEKYQVRCVKRLEK